MSEETAVEKVDGDAKDTVDVEKIKADLKKEVYKQLEKEGCPKELLDQWAAQFGPLGFVPIGDKLYVIRALLRKEWKEMNKVWNARAQGDSPITELDTEEEIASKATLWPEISALHMKTKMPAGIVTSLATAITGHAGFVPNATPIVF